jgi:esterase/lipase superfamily enzyme
MPKSVCYRRSKFLWLILVLVFGCSTQEEMAPRPSPPPDGAARTETAPPVRPLPPPPPPGEKKNGSSAKVENLNGKNVTVWYGTNRTPSNPFSAEDPYSSVRAQDLEFGTCTVRIPKSHKRGSLGSWTYYLTGRDEPIRFIGATPMVEVAFWAKFVEHLQLLQGSDRRVFVFIHGFNNSFEDAAIRTAQLWADLGIAGIPAFFSWPSRGGTLDYTIDEATVEASEEHLRRFLVGIQANLRPDSVHVVAHSMGNRPLLRVVAGAIASATEQTGLQFAQVFLAAPDVDVDLFNRLAVAYPKVSQRTTLYVSTNDSAVFTSAGVHGYQRVGNPPPFVNISNIDTVEVRANRGLFDLGHGYFSEFGPVLDDISSLITTGVPGRARRIPGSDDKTQAQFLIE